MGKVTKFFFCACLGALSGVVNAQTTVEYIHTDALGSVVAVTDASGNVIERREYEPYGAQLTPFVQNGPGYTGHVQDAATGLTYMQQRYYDPLLGIFYSVDPVTALHDPIGYFHRYKYANNNPYRFTDPDGRCWACDFLPVPIEGRSNPHAPIPGANRGDALVVGGLAATATLGATAAVAVTVGAPAMVMSAAEGASLQTGLAAQHGLNVTANTAAAINAATTGAAVHTMAAVDAEVSMALTAAGASSNTASAAGATAAALTPGVAAEFATGVITGASGVESPASSVTNQIGSQVGAMLREDLSKP